MSDDLPIQIAATLHVNPSMTLYKISPDNQYLLEEYDAESDHLNSIGLWFDGVCDPKAGAPLHGLSLNDYDGVFALTDRVIPWLEALGAIISDEFKN